MSAIWESTRSIKRTRLEMFVISGGLDLHMPGLPIAVNCSILFQELPVNSRAAAARAAGFGAVEFWWPFTSAHPTRQEIDEFSNAIESSGTVLIGLNVAAGDMSSGDRGLVSWPGREDEFRASVEVAVEIGQRLGTKSFNMLYGNRVSGYDAADQDELAIRNLAWAATRLAEIEGRMLIEPLSGAPSYPLRTASDVATCLSQLRDSGVTNVGLLADLYHMATNGDVALQDGLGGEVGHVQVADVPGRHRPGTGELSFVPIISDIIDAGYEGYVSLEYIPQGATAVDLAKFRPEVLFP